MTTTNKLVRLEDARKIIEDIYHTAQIVDSINALDALPTYPEPTKWSNHALLQGYIARDYQENLAPYEVVAMLKDIKSQLTEWTEYEIGKEYEFSDDGYTWDQGEFIGVWYGRKCWFYWKHIRPIQVSTELTSAISVLEANWYTVCKK